MQKRYHDGNAGLIVITDATGKIASVERYTKTEQPIASSYLTSATIAVTINGAAVPLSDSAHLSSNGPHPGV